MKASRTFLISTYLLGLTSAFNLQCARYCQDEKSIFGYNAGDTYTYNYEGVVRSLLNSTKSDESAVFFTSKVDIHVLSSCDFMMQIQDTSIKEQKHQNNQISTNQNDAKYLSTKLEENFLHFSFQNGKIESICPNQEELTEILNIKRGILSIFQNNMKTLEEDILVYENDVTGNCETAYKFLNNSNGIYIKKLKNLDACTERKSKYLSWQTVPNLHQTQAKSTPLLRSSLECTQKYNQDIVLEKSICEEVHAFQPLSNDNHGVMTIITQTLLLDSVRKESKKSFLKVPKNMIRSKLIFEYPKKSNEDIDAIGTISLLRMLERKTENGVEAEVPGLFSKLVYELQNLNSEKLLDVFGQISTHSRSFFLDALSLVSTADGIEVMIQLYKEEKITTEQINSWVTSLTFIKAPTLEIILATKPLLSIPEIKQKAILAISSALYRYCQTDENCIQQQSILHILKEIEEPLNQNCIPTQEEDNKSILLALKGIGNAGTVSNLHLLQNCYSNEDLSLEIRLAAIAAHRRISCVKNFNLDDFRNNFANRRENIEIRIASYLANMQCASYASFAQVKDVLLREEVNQVGSFVWTHLTNLQETSTPWKQGLRKLLENEFLKNKFNTDLRKYSRNYEASTFFDSLGSGVAVESNVIFTPESYLPRSAMLNFTLDLFGETINAFEFGARMEGFEEIVENLFGPEGYFSDKSIKSLLENVKQNHADEINDRIKELGENFRSQRILQKNPSGMIYAKVFGNEFAYTYFNNLNEFRQPISTKQIIDMFLNLFRNKDIDLKKSVVFLDTNYKIPTVLGFPLELVANGTATFGLKVKGNINLKDIWSYKMEIKGEVYPSTSVEVNGALSVDMFNTKSGIKYVGTLNSNIYLDGHAFIDGGKVVDVQINVPKKKIDIINVTSDVFIFQNDQAFKIQDASENKYETVSCSGDLFGKITGLELCSDLKYVNASQSINSPYFPLTGSFRYSLFAKKVDEFESYKLYFKSEINRSNDFPKYDVNVYLDTPNSIVNRKVNVTFDLDMQRMSLKSTVESPFAHFEINSNIGNKMNNYYFKFQTLYNKKEVLSLDSSFVVDKSNEGLKYEPMAKLTYLEKQIAAIKGSVKTFRSSSYSANLKIEGIAQEPIDVKVETMYGENDLVFQTSVNSKTLKANMQLLGLKTSEGINLNSQMNYTYKSNSPQKVSFEIRYEKPVQGPMIENEILIHFTSTQDPRYNLYAQLHHQRGNWFLKNFGRLTIFENNWNLDQEIRLPKTNKNTNFDIHLYLTNQEQGIDYRLATILNTSRNYLHFHTLFQLNLNQRIEALVKYNNNETDVGIYSLFYYPKQSWIFECDSRKIETISTSNYVFDFIGSRGSPGLETKFISIKGDYSNSSIKDVQDHKINCTLDLSESTGRWATPWNIFVSIQKSKKLFLSFGQIKTKEDILTGNMQWMKDSFAFNIQTNDKRLVVVKGSQNKKTLSVMLGLNIYQHFELSAKLQLPFDKFDLEFYWNKDRYPEQKFILNVEKNVYKGLYNVNVEYPNQKISAAFVLLPTQVTMNVTWGVVVSHKIYLKVGNKLYDIGGIWFGELETPFEFLQKQEFQLKYYVASKSFEVQSDISWCDHAIHFLVSGSRSNKHIAGNLLLNTTLPPLAIIEFAAKHAHQSNDNYKTDATFKYNIHEISGVSNWKLDGLNIDSNFKIESPTNLIHPIGGSLIMNFNTTTTVNFLLEWNRRRSVEIQMSLRGDASNIKILTEFEGFEYTHFEYDVKSIADSVALVTIVDIFDHYNSVKFDWKNQNEAIIFWMELASPITGDYAMSFIHSTNLGVLKETISIKNITDGNNLIYINLEGNMMPILKMNVTAGLDLFGHEASFSIRNGVNPISSLIRASWDKFNVTSKIMVEIDSSDLAKIEFVISSTVLKDDIVMRYRRTFRKYILSLNLPQKFSLQNILDLDQFSNNFTLETANIRIYINAYSNETETKSSQFFLAKINEVILDCSYNTDLMMDGWVKNLNIIQTSNNKKNLEIKANLKNKISEKNGVVLINLPVVVKIEGNMFRNGSADFTLQKDNSKIEAKGIVTKILGVKMARFTLHSNGEDFPSTNVDFSANYNTENSKGDLNLKIIKNSSALLDLHLLGSDEEGLLSCNQKIFENNYFDSHGKYSLNKNGLFIYHALNKENGFSSILNFEMNYLTAKNFSLTLNHGNKELKIKSDFTVDILENSADFEGSLEAYYKLIEEDGAKFNLTINKIFGNVHLNEFRTKLKVGLNSNFEKFRNIQLVSEYALDEKGVEASLNYQQNLENYILEFSKLDWENSFEISSKISAPNFAPFGVQLNSLRKDFEYTIQILLNVHDRLYESDILVSTLQNGEASVKFQINIPDNRYGGLVQINFEKHSQKFDAILAHSNETNKFSYIYESNNLGGKLNAILQLDWIELPLQKLDLNYDVTPQKINFGLNFDNGDLNYGMKGEGSKERLNFKINKGDLKDFIVVTGDHNYNSFSDFSFSYSFLKDGKKFKIDILNYFGNIYQTKFDVTTPFREWSRITLESKLDGEKIRISCNAKNYRVSLLAKKFNPEGGDLLSINYQGESLLVITASSGQLIITGNTNNDFGGYRLFAQFTPVPGIYAFSILKKGDNLISIVLQNFTNDDYFNFKGKLIAFGLFSDAISVQLLANRNITKSFEIKISDSSKKLLELKWGSNITTQVSQGYIKFESKLPFVEKFEVHPSLNMSSLDFKANFTVVSFGKENFYSGQISFPENQSKILLIEYPCQIHTICKVNFEVSLENFLFIWLSPLQNWKDVSLLTTIKFVNNSIWCDLFLKKDFKSVKMLWNIDLQNKPYKVETLFINTFLPYQYKFHGKGEYSPKNNFTLELTIHKNDTLQEEFFLKMNKNYNFKFAIFASKFNLIRIEYKPIKQNHHAQIVEFVSDLIDTNGFVSYNLTSNFALVSSKFISYPFQIDISGNCKTTYNFSKGNLDIVNQSKNYTFDWETEFTKNSIFILGNFTFDTKNKLILGMYQTSPNLTKANLKINQDMELDIVGQKLDYELKGGLVLKTPLKSLEMVKVHTTAKHPPSRIEFENLFSWKIDDQEDSVDLRGYVNFQEDYKSAKLNFTSSFTKSLGIDVDYNYQERKHILLFETILGEKFIKLQSNFESELNLDANFTSSFGGIKSCILSTNFNKKLDNVGKTPLEPSYELQVKLVSSDGRESVGNAYLNLEKTKFNASVIFLDNPITVFLGLENNVYKLQLESPFYYAKNIYLQGIHSKISEVHSLQISGNWNEKTVSGEFNLEPNGMYMNIFGNGFLNVTFTKTEDYQFVFSYHESNKYLDLLLYFSEKSLEIDAKSHFDFMRFLKIKTNFVPYQKLEIDLKGDLAQKDLLLYNLIEMKNKNLKEIFRYMDTNLEIQGNPRFGKIHIFQNTSLYFNNIALDYVLEDYRLETNFDMKSNRYNTSRSVIFLFKNNQEIEYGIIFGDHKILEKVTQNQTHANVEVFIQLPCIKIEKFKFNLSTSKTNKTFDLIFNKFYLNAEYFHRNFFITKIKSFSPYFDFWEYNHNMSIIDGGYEFNTTLKQGDFERTRHIIYVNNDGKIKLEVNSSENGEKTGEIIIDGLNKVLISIRRTIHLQFEKQSFLNLVLSTNSPLSLKVSPNLIQIVYPTYKIDLALKILYNELVNNKTYEFTYENHGKMLYRGSFIMIRNLDLEYIIRADLSEVHKSKLIEFHTVLREDSFEIEWFLDIFNMSQEINFIFDKDYVNYNMKIRNLPIENKDFALNIIANSLKNITFYTSVGNVSEKNYLKFESFFKFGLIKVSIDCPNLSHLKSLDLDANWDFETNNTAQASTKLISDTIGDTNIFAKFAVLENLLDVEAHLKVPFLQNFERFDGKIYIPKEFRPHIEIILPTNQKYIFKFNHVLNKEIINLHAEYQFDQFKLDWLFDYSIKERVLEVAMLIPCNRFKYFGLILKNPHFEINLNNRKYTFDYLWIDKEAHKAAKIILTTPFLMYEEYSIDLEYKTGSEEVIKFIIFSPNLKRKIGLNFGINYKSISSFRFIYEISSPIPINSFDFVKILIANEFQKEKLYYKFESSASTNGYNLNCNITSLNTTDQKNHLINLVFNKEQIFAQIWTVGRTIAHMKMGLELKTSLESVRHLKLAMNSSYNKNPWQHNHEILASFNDFNFAKGYFKLDKHKFALLLQNLFYPISIDYENSRNFHARICWNINEKESSQIGGHLIYSENKKSFGLYLPYINYTLDQINQNNDTSSLNLYQIGFNNNLMILSNFATNLKRNGGISFKSSWNLELPFRTFKIVKIIEATTTPSSMNYTYIFTWRKEEELIFESKILPGKLFSTIKSPALPHDIVLKVDMSKFGVIPSQFIAELKYDSDPKKLIQFEMYYNKEISKTFSTNRTFIFKHPSSKIDYVLNFNSFKSFIFSNGSLQMRYYDETSTRYEIIKMSIKVNHDKFGILGNVETSRNKFHLEAASISTEDSLGFLMETQINHKDPLHLECNYIFQKISPSFNLLASHGESKKYQFYAGLPNDKEITAKSWHEMYGRYFLDNLLTLRLNNSQLLWIKLLWKNDVHTELQRAIFEEYTDLRFVIEATGRELIDVMQDDIGTEFINDASEIKQRVITYVHKEKNKIFEEFAVNHTLSNLLTKIINQPQTRKLAKSIITPIEDVTELIYKTFKVVCEDALASVEYSLDKFGEQLRTLLNDIQSIKYIKIDAKDILKKVISNSRRLLKKMEVTAIKLLDDFDKYVSGLKEQIEVLFEPLLNLLDDFVVLIEQRLALLQMAILNALDTIQMYVLNLRETREMFIVYTSYINWLEELHLTDLLEPVGNVIEEILETIINDSKRVFENYKLYIDAIAEAIYGKYDGIFQLPPVTELREIVNRFYQKTIWIWNYHNMTESLKSAIYKLSGDIDKVLSFVEVDDADLEIEMPFEDAGYVFRPEIGYVEISQPLPVEWEAFNKAPAFQEHPLYQKIQKKAEQFVKFYKNRYGFIDNLDEFFDIFSEHTVSPITYNFAMVIGSSHFITFNNGYYNFFSNCSYLLASDFKTNSFSLVINYKIVNSTLSRTLEIISNQASIEIDNDQILFNKKVASLPLVYEHISVVRELENFIIESTKGFKMICNINFKYCAIELSGWMFGKTAGLLGTLDNEKLTDTLSSNGTQSKNIHEFIDSWKIQNSCLIDESKIETPNYQGLIGGLLGNLCQIIFTNANSPLAECFGIVDVQPFLEMCLGDMRTKTDPVICNSMAAYKVRCLKSNVRVELPELCVQCKEGIGNEEKIFDGHNPKSIDVVFITELDCYNSNLGDLPSLIDNKLRLNGFHHIRFANVGFGGSTLAKPHLYTNSNRIWSNTSTTIKYKLGNDKWNGKKYKTFDALIFAAGLEFRPGVPKMFVLTHCEYAKDLSISPDLYNMLAEKDITLHVLKKQPFNNIKDDISGINANNLVLYKGSTTPATNEMVIQTLTDIYSGLALSTNGTVFDFDGTSIDDNWSEFVVSTAKESPCQKCKCISDLDGVGKIECKRCLNPAVKNFLNEYEASHNNKY